MINASSNPAFLKLSTLKASEVISALHSQTLLITATPRQAAEWKRRFAISQQQEVVETPPVLFWDEWLSHCYHELSDLPVPLTQMQEMLLWEKIIRDDLGSSIQSQHLSFKGLAKRASEAYAIMRNHLIDADALTLGGEESEALARWISAIHREMRKKSFENRMLSADAPHLLNASRLSTILPEAMIVDGFELISPLQQQIIQTLRQHGCRLLSVADEEIPATPSLTPCQDNKSELEHLALRVKALLDDRPSTRIAVLTNDTFTDQKALRRVMDQLLMPDSLIDPLCDKQSIALPGDPLSDWPMIQQTLQLLSLAGKKRLPFNEFSTLLFSAWLDGFDEERLERASFEAALRQQNRHHISLTSLVQSEQLDHLPRFKAVIAEISAWESGGRTAAEWVKSVHSLLQSTGLIQAGLDHQSTRSNSEIRQMNKFKDVLTSLIAADAILKQISWPQFQSILRTTCSQTRLAPPSLYPNVSVLPLTQLTGLTFDHIFVIGMNAQAFPAAAKPQPLLPLSLQRKHRIPMSSGAVQYDSAQWLWSQLLVAAPHIEISYCRQQDERELKPSSFVQGFIELSPLQIDNGATAMEMESFNDTQPVPLQVIEKVRGGTRIIKNQSDCPFRAFVAHRINLASLGQTSPGLEPTTKGSLIHSALEMIWKQLKSQKRLLSLTETEKESLIEQSIDHAWQRDQNETTGTKTAAIEKFERKRMARLLSQWLDLEATRPPFEVIAIEKLFELNLPENSQQKLHLRIKADRMDRDSQQHNIVIDYKTGRQQSPARWLGERMEQPQLPLYAVAAGLGEHDAVAFGTLRSGDQMRFEGLAGENIGIKGIEPCDGKYKRPDSWQEVMDGWSANLNHLAQEFVDGRSDVAPRNSAACVYCTFEALCRVEETGIETDTGDEA